MVVMALGGFRLRELRMTVVLAGLFVWSVVRDRRVMTNQEVA